MDIVEIHVFKRRHEGQGAFAALERRVPQMAPQILECPLDPLPGRGIVPYLLRVMQVKKMAPTMVSDKAPPGWRLS